MAKYTYTEKPFPLKYMEKFEKDYPEIWKTCDIYRNFINERFDWDSLSYCPVEVFNQLIFAYNQIHKNNVVEMYNLSMCSIFNWKKYKQIYVFDSDFVNVLVDSNIADNDIKIDDVIKTLPFTTFYVDISGKSGIVIDDMYNIDGSLIQGGTLTGFFVYFNTNVYKKGSMKDPVTTLHFDVYSENGSFGYEVIVHDGLTLKTSFNKLRTDVLGDSANTELSIKNCTNMENVITKLMKLIMYICTVNSDISKSTKQNAVRNDKSINTNSDTAKISSKIKISDVGFKIGKAIRLSKSNIPTSSIEDDNTENTETELNTSNKRIGKSVPKRPHIRRGHFHHYWTGSSTTGNRQLVLKWLAPTFININTDKDLIVNIIPVEN